MTYQLAIQNCITTPLSVRKERTPDGLIITLTLGERSFIINKHNSRAEISKALTTLFGLEFAYVSGCGIFEEWSNFILTKDKEMCNTRELRINLGDFTISSNWCVEHSAKEIVEEIVRRVRLVKEAFDKAFPNYCDEYSVNLSFPNPAASTVEDFPFLVQEGVMIRKSPHGDELIGDVDGLYFYLLRGNRELATFSDRLTKKVCSVTTTIQSFTAGESIFAEQAEFYVLDDLELPCFKVSFPSKLSEQWLQTATAAALKKELLMRLQLVKATMPAWGL